MKYENDHVILKNTYGNLCIAQCKKHEKNRRNPSCMANKQI